MLRKILRAKIHRATVTQTHLDYVGSITIDQALMESADIAEYECVLVADLDNGTRHETYVIPGERGSGQICINGAAAHLVETGHKVIIMCFGYQDIAATCQAEKPTILLVDDNNKIVKKL